MKIDEMLDPLNGPVRKIIRGSILSAIDAHATFLSKNVKDMIAEGATKRVMGALTKGDGPLRNLLNCDFDPEKCAKHSMNEGMGECHSGCEDQNCPYTHPGPIER